jgi:DNA-binding transcriptional LysR family regulator
MQTDLDLDLVRCFVAVAQANSFTQAARTVHRSQSAVSTRVLRLEETLGTRLFDRNSRSVLLTSDGERFLGYALRMLQLNDAAVGELMNGQLSGTLSLGIVEYLAPHRLPVLLAKAKRQMPRLELSVRLGLSDELLSRFDEGQLDVVLVKHQDDRAGGRSLLTEKLVWVQGEQSAHTSEDVPLCLLPSPCAFRSAAIDALTQLRRPWHEAITASSILGVQACVIAGLGVTALGESSVVKGMSRIPPGEQWPALPDLQISVYGQQNEATARSIVDLIVSETLNGQ